MLERRRPDLTTCTVEDEVVILDRATGYVHQLNVTASEIWSVCDGQHSADEIAAHLAQRFSATPASVVQDVESTLADFGRLGLLLDREPWGIARQLSAIGRQPVESTEPI